MRGLRTFAIDLDLSDEARRVGHRINCDRLSHAFSSSSATATSGCAISFEPALARSAPPIFIRLGIRRYVAVVQTSEKISQCARLPLLLAPRLWQRFAVDAAAVRRDRPNGSEWAAQRARYMRLETIAPLCDDPIVGLPAVATPGDGIQW